MQSFSLMEVSTALTTGLLSYVAGSKVYENWKMKRVMARLSGLKENSAAVPKPIEPKRASQKPTEGLAFGGSCESSFVSVGR